MREHSSQIIAKEKLTSLFIEVLFFQVPKEDNQQNKKRALQLEPL